MYPISKGCALDYIEVKMLRLTYLWAYLQLAPYGISVTMLYTKNSYRNATKAATYYPNSHINKMGWIKGSMSHGLMHVIAYIFISAKEDCISNRLSQKGSTSSSKQACKLKINNQLKSSTIFVLNGDSVTNSFGLYGFERAINRTTVSNGD